MQHPQSLGIDMDFRRKTPISNSRPHPQASFNMLAGASQQSLGRKRVLVCLADNSCAVSVLFGCQLLSRVAT